MPVGRPVLSNRDIDNELFTDLSAGLDQFIYDRLGFVEHTEEAAWRRLMIEGDPLMPLIESVAPGWIITELTVDEFAELRPGEEAEIVTRLWLAVRTSIESIVFENDNADIGGVTSAG